MTKEDRSHRDHTLNPRKHPRGIQAYKNPSKERIWGKIGHAALLSLPECLFLQDVPRLLGDGNYANLGHALGGSAILLASGIRENDLDARVYSVDIRFEKGCNARMEKHGLLDYVQQCKGGTNDWAVKLADKQFNFVFIDADHTYEAVKTDFGNWAPLIKEGGWVSFHDINQDFSHQAIEDTVAKVWPELKEFNIDRIRTFQKREK